MDSKINWGFFIPFYPIYPIHPGINLLDPSIFIIF